MRVNRLAAHHKTIILAVAGLCLATLTSGWVLSRHTYVQHSPAVVKPSSPDTDRKQPAVPDEHIVILPPMKERVQQIESKTPSPQKSGQPVQSKAQPAQAKIQPTQNKAQPTQSKAQPAHTVQAPKQLPKQTPKRAKYEPEYGAYLGAYTELNSYIQGSMELFNDLTGKKHASFFRYVGYGMPFPKAWVAQVKELGALPQIAWEPNNGLDKVQDDEYLRTFARAAREANTPIFMRFASEMNGDWVAYSGNPKLYIEKWRLVDRVMKEEAPNVAMLWVVFTEPRDRIAQYYPGDEYVDWVGVNVYNVVYRNNSIQERVDHEDPIGLVQYVYDRYSATKPIMIGEYGVAHYTVTDESSHILFAINRLKRMYLGLKQQYPRVKAIYYFDVNCIADAPPDRRINNYSVTDNEEVLAAYKHLISDPYFLSKVDTYNPAFEAEPVVTNNTAHTPN